jgi:predicted RNA polymerase sigma factor
MKYMLLLRFPPGSGPQEGTPEFDAEMDAWGAVNDELKAAGAWARAAYRRAIALTDNTRERAALERRAATLPGAAHA